MEYDIRHDVESVKERTIRSETKLDSIITWKDRHEDSDEKRFERMSDDMKEIKDDLSDKIEMLSVNQTKIMAYGVAAFTVITILVQVIIKYLPASV